jgi:hypothetical protein
VAVVVMRLSLWDMQSYRKCRCTSALHVWLVAATARSRPFVYSQQRKGELLHCTGH